jgi:hypothetical protein
MSSEKDDPPDPIALTTPDDFFRDSGLYAWRRVSEPSQFDALLKVRFGRIQIDMHCIWCERQSVFWSDKTTFNITNNDVWKDGYFVREFNCSREAAHAYRFYFAKFDDRIWKIGQWPAFETIANADIEPFRAVLDSCDYKELHRAGGLYSHGVGIGAFVCLRRIFERLVEQHRPAGLPDEDWRRLRMDERILAAKGELPRLLVENRALYGVLSKGIHELTEAECLQYFQVVRNGLMLILRQHLEAKKTRDAEAEFTKSLGAITQKTQSAKAAAPES